jgi:hypothetical protein
MPLCYTGGIKTVDHAHAIVDGVTDSLPRRGDNASLVHAILTTLSTDRASTRSECYRIIEQRYNPHWQIETTRSALTR